MAITRARVEGELRALKSNLLELTGSVIRLRTQVREIEIQGESQIQSRMSQVGEAAEGFDPLEFDRYTRFQELTRSLAEGVNDVSTVQQSLLKNLDDADAALVAQARLSRDVQQQLFSIRTVPFASMSERLYRIMRATAKELDKRANLEIRGGQVELDRSVLEKLAGPLEHLLRNALDHGVEPRATRVAAGKAGDRRDHADGAPGRQRNRDRDRRRRRGPRFRADPCEGARARPHRRRCGAHRCQSDRIHLRAGILDRDPGHAGVGPRHRHGRRARRNRGARRTGRSDVAARTRHDVPALPSAYARGCAGRARACGRPALGAAGAHGRAGPAGQGRGAAKHVRAAPGRMEGRRLSAVLSAAASRRRAAQSGDGALQSRSSAARRAEHHRDPRRRNGRQPGSRGQEHRAAARSRFRHRRRDRARHRRDRADHQPGAARAAGEPAVATIRTPSASRVTPRRRRRSRSRRWR